MSQEIKALLDRYEQVKHKSSKEWGPVIWGILHKTVELIPCYACKLEGRILIQGIHDIVNIHLGKPPKTPSSLCILAAQAMHSVKKAELKECSIYPSLRHDEAPPQSSRPEPQVFE